MDTIRREEEAGGRRKENAGGKDEAGRRRKQKYAKSMGSVEKVIKLVAPTDAFLTSSLIASEV